MFIKMAVFAWNLVCSLGK